VVLALDLVMVLNPAKLTLALRIAETNLNDELEEDFA
jgi:hypothetical protein